MLIQKLNCKNVGFFPLGCPPRFLTTSIYNGQVLDRYHRKHLGILLPRTDSGEKLLPKLHLELKIILDDTQNSFLKEVPVGYTRYGQECQGACKKYLGWFHDYYFCQKSKRSESFWDDTIGWLLNKAFDKLGVRPLKWLNDGIGKIFGNDSDWEYCSAEPTRTMWVPHQN